MTRFNRLRKTIRKLAKLMGHEPGYFIFTSPDQTHEAKCIYCGLEMFIIERADIKINKKQFNNPFNLSSVVAAKLYEVMKEQLQIKLYGPDQTGYIYGPALKIFCEKNPAVEKIPLPMP